MELEEAFRRIVGQHLRLIVGFAVIGFAVAAFSHLGGGTSYTATARLVLDTPDPKSRTEAGRNRRHGPGDRNEPRSGSRRARSHRRAQEFARRCQERRHGPTPRNLGCLATLGTRSKCAGRRGHCEFARGPGDPGPARRQQRQTPAGSRVDRDTAQRPWREGLEPRRPDRRLDS